MILIPLISHPVLPAKTFINDCFRELIFTSYIQVIYDELSFSCRAWISYADKL